MDDAPQTLQVVTYSPQLAYSPEADPQKARSPQLKPNGHQESQAPEQTSWQLIQLPECPLPGQLTHGRTNSVFRRRRWYVTTQELRTLGLPVPWLTAVSTAAAAVPVGPGWVLPRRSAAQRPSSDTA